METLMILQSLISNHFAILTVTFLATWLYSLKGKFLIDDHEGVERFCDKFAITKDDKGNTVKEDVIDWYEENGKKWKNLQFNPSVGFYSGALRFLRVNFCKKFIKIAKNQKGHDVWGYVQDPFRHHIFSLVVHYLNVILGYIFLSKVLGEDLAFKSMLLFSVHPITCQAVAWISGLGYLLSLFFTFLVFNAALILPNDISFLPIVSLDFLSVSALLAGISNPIILAFLGKWHAFAATLAISICLLATWGKTIVTVRTKAFEEQNMEKSTKFNLRKPIVIIKTFYYYVRLIVFPKRMGLFHVWGYHYDDSIERTNRDFWLGLLVMVALFAAFVVAPFPVRFGMLWMFSYLIVFSNIITAQQFVADRYAFVSTVGYCIIVSYFLRQFPELFYLVLGLYAMRTMVHLPTFKDDENLYESNIFNFPDSEVAYANLGVILNQNGRPNGAIDMWQESSRVDNFYDVPHYNLYSIMKSGGQLEQACEELKRCLNSKTVHFKTLWEKEFQELNLHVARKREFDDLNNRLNAALANGRFEEIPPLKQALDELSKRPIAPVTVAPTAITTT